MLAFFIGSSLFMKKKLLLLLLCTCELIGCGSKSSLVYNTFMDAVSQPPSYEISAEQLSKLPYAVIYGQLGDGPQALIVLAYAKGLERQWLTAEKESLTTISGRLVRTAGFKSNIANISFDNVDPLQLPLSKIDGALASGTIDFLPNYQFGLRFNSQFFVRKKQDVNLGPNKKELTLVEEKFNIPSLRYKTVNKYWIDKDGLVWKSEQSPLNDLPIFKLTLLKPFSGDLK